MPATDELDDLLREPDRYIADAGFSARTMARLPRRPGRLRRAVLLAAFSVATLTAALLFSDVVALLRELVGRLSVAGAVHALLARAPLALLGVAALALVAGLTALVSAATRDS